MKTRKKFGLVLGSGAVRGLAHIGVIRALERHNIPIDIITGTSIGACIGAHYALYQDVDKLQADATQKKKDVFLVLLDPGKVGGLVQGDKMEKLLNTWWDAAEFKDLEIPFKAVATDLISGKPVVIDKGTLSTAARASSSVPGFFTPIKYEDKFLIDGAMSCPVPVELARQMGADVILAVNLYSINDAENKKIKRWSLDKVAFRSAEIIINSLAEENMKSADFIIRPDMNIYSRPEKYFTEQREQEAIDIGEKETEQIVKKIKQALES